MHLPFVYSVVESGSSLQLNCLHYAVYIAYTSSYMKLKPRKPGTTVLWEKTGKTKPEMGIVELQQPSLKPTLVSGFCVFNLVFRK